MLDSNRAIAKIFKGQSSISKVLKNNTIIWEKNVLPVGYTKCAYLQGNEADASTYLVIPEIDIMNKPNVLLEVAYPTYRKDTNAFGSILNNIRFEQGIGWLGKSFSYNFGNGYGATGGGFDNVQTEDGTVSANTLAGKHLLIEYRNDTFYINNIEQTVAKRSIYANGEFGIAKDVYIFGTNRGTALRYFAGKIYRFIVEGQIDLIPAIDRSGKPCMYDTISKQTFYNQGSGEFGYELIDGTYVSPK